MTTRGSVWREGTGRYQIEVLFLMIDFHEITVHYINRNTAKIGYLPPHPLRG